MKLSLNNDRIEFKDGLYTITPKGEHLITTIEKSRRFLFLKSIGKKTMSGIFLAAAIIVIIAFIFPGLLSK